MPRRTRPTGPGTTPANRANAPAVRTAAEIAARLGKRTTLLLLRPIWSPGLGRRVDPPAVVLVDAAVADWLQGTGRASDDSSGRARALDLGADLAIPRENVLPGERYWWLDDVAGDDRARGDGVLVELGGRELRLRVGRLAEREARAGAFRIIGTTSRADDDFECVSTTQVLRLSIGDGSPDDPGAREAWKRGIRDRGLIAARERAHRQLAELVGLPEHVEAEAQLGEVEAIVRGRMGPGGQLSSVDALRVREALRAIGELAERGRRRRERQTLKPLRDGLAKGGRAAAAKRKGTHPTATRNFKILDAANDLARSHEPRDIAALLARREWPDGRGGTKKLSARTIRGILQRCGWIRRGGPVKTKKKHTDPRVDS